MRQTGRAKCLGAKCLGRTTVAITSRTVTVAASLVSTVAEGRLRTAVSAIELIELIELLRPAPGRLHVVV